MSNEVTLFVELFSEDACTTKTRELKLPSFPGTFMEVKEQIEKSFSIPVCVQTLHYQSHQVADTEVPSALYVRSGDTLKVTYPTEGDCEKVKETMEWLKQLVKLVTNLNKIATKIYRDTAYIEYESMWFEPFFKSRAIDLSERLLYPWTDRSKYINKLHLQSIGAVPLVIDLYNNLLHIKSIKAGFFGEYFLEQTCALFVTNFTQTFPLRRYILEHGGLECCIRTFTWKPIEDCYVLDQRIEFSIYGICNISELPECQLELAKRSELITQALSMCTSPVYSCKSAVISTSFLLGLAQCREAHEHLLQPRLMEKLFEMCERRKTSKVSFRALQSYAGVVLALMTLGSPELVPNLPKPLLQQTVELMDTICSYSTADISAYEIKEGLVWESFLPFILFLYNPVKVAVRKPEPDDELWDLILRVSKTSTDVIFFTLENAFSRPEHVSILVKEGLLEYMMILLWHVPAQCQVRVQSLLQNMNKVVQIQPPKLCSLVKAKLAMTSLGLHKVLTAQSLSDILLS